MTRTFDQIEILSDEESEQYSEESIINQFADAMADAGEGAFFRVELKERQGASGKPIAYNDHCGRYYLSELGHFMDLVERIQSEFGHGKYLFTLYGGGQRGIIKKQVVSIAKSTETETTKNQLQTAQTGGDLKELIANMLQAQQAQMQQFLQAMQPQQSRKEYFEELLMMKQFFTSDEKPSGRAGNPVKETLEMLALMKDGGLMGSNDNQESDGFSRLIDKAAPLFAAAIQGQQQAPQMQAAARQGQPMRKRKPQQNPAANASQGQKVTKINQEKEQADGQMIKFLIAQKINSLVKAASEQKDPYIFAEVLCNEFGLPMALEYAAKSDSLTRICAINPKAAQYESWFLDLAEYVKAIGGQPSKFSSEFDDFTEIAADDGILNDGEQLPINEHTERRTGNQGDIKDNVKTGEPMESSAADPGTSVTDNEKSA